MITNSTIGGPFGIVDLVEAIDNDGYIKETTQFNKVDFKITVANLQRDKNCVAKNDNDDDDDEDDCGDDCYFDYMGNIKIAMNRKRSTYLGREAE